MRAGVRLGMGTVAMLRAGAGQPATSCAAPRPGCTRSACVLLLVVDGIGYIGKGAQRWLDLGLSSASSRREIMKLAVPMMCAWYLHERPLPPSCPSLGGARRAHPRARGAGRGAAGPGHRRADRHRRRRWSSCWRACSCASSLALARARRASAPGSAGASCTTTSASACSPSSIRRPIRSARATTSSSRRSPSAPAACSARAG